MNEVINILEKLLYGDRESLSPNSIDEKLSYAITKLKVYKQKRKNNVRIFR